ncbi:MAG: hypothetical protein HW377_2771 [Actinobacteria bacterium]|nr:hypothetical protein [Actinomycetota bacterium]
MAKQELSTILVDMNGFSWENTFISNPFLGVRMGRPTTVISPGIRVLPAVVAITLLLPLLFAGTALAADLSLSSKTYGLLYERELAGGRKDRYAPLYEYLSADAANLGGKPFSPSTSTAGVGWTWERIAAPAVPPGRSGASTWSISTRRGTPRRSWAGSSSRRGRRWRSSTARSSRRRPPSGWGFPSTAASPWSTPSSTTRAREIPSMAAGYSSSARGSWKSGHRT